MSDWPFDPALKEFGAVYRPATVAPGQPYWKLIVADGPMDIGGNISLFVDVWDEKGHRVVGVPVLFYWRDTKQREDRKLTEPKPGDPFAVDLPMYAAGNAYGVRVDDGLPSDDIFGFGLGSFVPHHSFRAIFQRTTGSGEPGPIEPGPQPEPPTQPTSAREAIDEALRWLGIAKGLL